MSIRDLRAAGIVDARLQHAYEQARILNAAHGKTYYLATLLLPREKRPYVHSLYGFARYADEIVDNLADTRSPEQRQGVLDEFSAEFRASIAHNNPCHPIIEAVRDTIRTWQLPLEHFDAFLYSMRMDIATKDYETFEDLYEYVYGSAAVIGLQMVPILEPSSARAYESAKDLGIAFQLANFIRDVGEDLERGRIYLPLAELRAHGVTREVLERRVTTDAVREALKEQISRVRRLQTQADDGISLLAPNSQPCIRAASILYCGIVDAVENIDYDVLNRRAVVPLSQRLRVAGGAWLRRSLSTRPTTQQPTIR